jgi:hypothetical protein
MSELSIAYELTPAEITARASRTSPMSKKHGHC